MDCSLPGFSVHGIFQARILEWVAVSFSRGSSRPRDWTQISHHCRQTLYPLSHQGSPEWDESCYGEESIVVQLLSHVWLFATPWELVLQAPLSMVLSRQEYWSGLPFPSPGDLPIPGINLCLLHGRQSLYHWAIRRVSQWPQTMCPQSVSNISKIHAPWHTFAV